MIANLALALLLSGSGVAGSAGQADSGVRIVQAPGALSPRGQVTAINQIGDADRIVPANPASPTAPVSSPQLTVEPGGAYAGPAGPVGETDVVAPVSAAQLADGRDLTAEIPTGPDRCDPQRRPLPVACDRVLEARAAEFQSRDPSALSPEERLIASQRELRPASTDLNSATRRLANGEVDVSEAGLAVASAALAGTPPDERDKDPADRPSALDAIVAGITTLITGAPPTP